MQKIAGLITAVLGLVTPDVAKQAVDAALDVVEDKVKDTKNKIDDVVVLPLCGAIRSWFDIPDNDK